MVQSSSLSFFPRAKTLLQRALSLRQQHVFLSAQSWCRCPDSACAMDDGAAERAGQRKSRYPSLQPLRRTPPISRQQDYLPLPRSSHMKRDSVSSASVSALREAAITPSKARKGSQGSADGELQHLMATLTSPATSDLSALTKKHNESVRSWIDLNAQQDNSLLRASAPVNPNLLLLPALDEAKRFDEEALHLLSSLPWSTAIEMDLGASTTAKPNPPKKGKRHPHGQSGEFPTSPRSPCPASPPAFPSAFEKRDHGESLSALKTPEWRVQVQPGPPPVCPLVYPLCRPIRPLWAHVCTP